MALETKERGPSAGRGSLVGRGPSAGRVPLVGRTRFARCDFLPLAASAACVACEGPFSTLDPAGRDATEIAHLFWWMVAGAALVWAVVMGLSVWAIFTGEHRPEKTRLFIIGGGTVFPLVMITALLVYGLSKMPGLLEEGAADAPRIRVTGEQYWWRIEYLLPDGRRFATANDLTLPVGQRVTFEVESADVVHSFWIPSLGGKIDMIPGRTNVLALQPTKKGTFGGWCAEYCGLAHARMRLLAHVVDEDAFAAWTEKQLAPSAAPPSAGSRLFVATGCGACHTVRGTTADGAIGPDLTHVGSRGSVGAGVLPNDPAGFSEFLTRLSHLKPESQMPTFDMLPASDVAVLSHYLESLK